MHLKRNKWDLFLERGTLFFYLTGVILIVVLWKQIPERVPIYFNWPGKVDGYGGPTVYFETLLLMGLVSLGIHKLSQSPTVLNASVNRQMGEPPHIMRLIRRMLQTLNLGVAFTWFAFSMSSLQQALETQIVDLGYLVSGLPFVLMGIPLIYTILVLRRKWGLLNRTKGRNR